MKNYWRRGKAIDQKEDWEYIEYVKSIFEPYDTEFYCVELVSNPGEVPFEHYLRIDNTDMPPEAAARKIKDTFGL